MGGAVGSLDLAGGPHCKRGRPGPPGANAVASGEMRKRCPPSVPRVPRPFPRSPTANAVARPRAANAVAQSGANAVARSVPGQAVLPATRKRCRATPAPTSACSATMLDHQEFHVPTSGHLQAPFHWTPASVRHRAGTGCTTSSGKQYPCPLTNRTHLRTCRGPVASRCQRRDQLCPLRN
jgi:hypothetical protein